MWAGRLFQAKRVESGMTQRRLAIALDVTEATIRNWEHGKTVPTLTPRQICTICEMLDLSIQELASFQEVIVTQVEVKSIAHRGPRQQAKVDLVSC
jgi:DNA-binding XRE family transcriptional regulator